MKHTRPATIAELHRGWLRVAEKQRIDVEKRWATYRDAEDSTVRRAILKWFLKSIKDDEFDELARMSICWHLVRNTHNLPDEFRKKFRKAISKLSRRQQKIIKLIR